MLSFAWPFPFELYYISSLKWKLSVLEQYLNIFSILISKLSWNHFNSISWIACFLRRKFLEKNSLKVPVICILIKTIQVITLKRIIKIRIIPTVSHNRFPSFFYFNSRFKLIGWLTHIPVSKPDDENSSNDPKLELRNQEHKIIQSYNDILFSWLSFLRVNVHLSLAHWAHPNSFTEKVPNE